MNPDWSVALERSVKKNVSSVDGILKAYPHIEGYAKRLRVAKQNVLDNLDEYVKKTCESVERSGGIPHVVRDRAEAQQTVKQICGEGGIVLFAKSNVALELELREALARDGHEVWETDMGEFLLQLGGGPPAHVVLPVIHLSREQVGRLLHDRIDPAVSADSTHEELVACARRFLFQKYVKAKVGITGANAIAADTGSVVLVENEGNIRADTVLPRIHVAVTGIDKIVPTLEDALLEAQVQAAHAGLYPPTYINVTSGPSTTADIESNRVTPATGPSEFHVILVDNGRTEANLDSSLREALLCIKCGRCYFSCPVYFALGSEWMDPPYGGPMGVMWGAIVAKETAPALLCTHSAGCKVVCPMGIDIPQVIEHIKWLNQRDNTAT